MILIKLTGGLGNQLFQYAYGKALSLKKKERLVLDTSWYKGRLNRVYLLDNFMIDAPVASWFTRTYRKNQILQDHTGEWHSEKYFKEYAQIIRDNFKLKTPPSKKAADLLQHINSVNSVSLHLRGTDYVTGNKSAFHGTASPEYYSQAVALMREKVQNPHFFIFTDDTPWARVHIQFPEPFTLVSESKNTACEELALMAFCKHNILANSTFSWWAAWLNPHKDKIVVAPSRWFADEKANASDILPSSWIKI
jgi:hypothetical protein